MARYRFVRPKRTPPPDFLQRVAKRQQEEIDNMLKTLAFFKEHPEAVPPIPRVERDFREHTQTFEENLADEIAAGFEGKSEEDIERFFEQGTHNNTGNIDTDDDIWR